MKVSAMLLMAYLSLFCFSVISAQGGTAVAESTNVLAKPKTVRFSDGQPMPVCPSFEHALQDAEVAHLHLQTRAVRVEQHTPPSPSKKAEDKAQEHYKKFFPRLSSPVGEDKRYLEYLVNLIDLFFRVAEIEQIDPELNFLIIGDKISTLVDYQEVDYQELENIICFAHRVHVSPLIMDVLALQYLCKVELPEHYLLCLKKFFSHCSRDKILLDDMHALFGRMVYLLKGINISLVEDIVDAPFGNVAYYASISQSDTELVCPGAGICVVDGVLDLSRSDTTEFVCGDDVSRHTIQEGERNFETSSVAPIDTLSHWEAISCPDIVCLERVSEKHDLQRKIEHMLERSSIYSLRCDRSSFEAPLANASILRYGVGIGLAEYIDLSNHMIQRPEDFEFFRSGGCPYLIRLNIHGNPCLENYTLQDIAAYINRPGLVVCDGDMCAQVVGKVSVFPADAVFLAE